MSKLGKELREWDSQKHDNCEYPVLYTIELMEKAADRLDDLEKDIAFLQSCVNSGEKAEVSDRPSNRDKP